MTATPRVYSSEVQEKAKEHDAVLASMDNEDMFGKVLFHRGFSWAVENDLLTDYKVIVLAVDEQMVSDTVQNRLSQGAQLMLDDATKIVGCYKALTKEDLRSGDLSYDPLPIRRALAFCKSIKASQTIEAEFALVAQEYAAARHEKDPTYQSLSCEVKHVDGSHRAKERESFLHWLKDDCTTDTCRILTNAKCLSEGVDVPALDAILFMHPRKSQIDVVQSVGRVMRRAPGKKLGYVVLPVVIPAGVEAHEALNDNKTYKVVWDVLQALRSHDDRFDAFVNKIDLIGQDTRKMEVVAITDKAQKKSASSKGGFGNLAQRVASPCRHRCQVPRRRNERSNIRLRPCRLIWIRYSHLTPL
ncbi:MAG: hypothetical protein HC845_08310 [Akkermansiaceae bacterium]|nr:hypothetical protein [Akkermansiaceae bacterium]